MKAIISTTKDDNYLFFVPLIVWSWKKLGIDTMCFFEPVRVPIDEDVKHFYKSDLIQHFTKDSGATFPGFVAPVDKKATYAQCSRLFAAATPLVEDDEVLITGDVDMAVFNKDFFSQFNDGRIHIVGADLVPDRQYPMCYIAMPTEKWREVMHIDLGQSHQDKLDQLLGHLECEHFRGNYWAKDQETAYNYICLHKLVKHNRAAPETQFATRRADRDGWPVVIPPDIIDAHLPRPGYTPENFAKILNLFQTMYPSDDFEWMISYRNEYVKIINEYNDRAK